VNEGVLIICHLMNIRTFSNVLVAVVAAFAAAGSAVAQSQHEMNRQAEADFEKADSELNRVYKKVLSDLDADGQKKLKAAQRAWIAFRDAQAEFDADSEARGGSMYTMIYYGGLARLTRDRIKQLRATSQ
jgi:uncharacterized protein YecT (DUF1311 family)